jgi:hypothetical protein
MQFKNWSVMLVLPSGSKTYGLAEALSEAELQTVRVFLIFRPSFLRRC